MLYKLATSKPVMTFFLKPLRLPRSKPVCYYNLKFRIYHSLGYSYLTILCNSNTNKDKWLGVYKYYSFIRWFFKFVSWKCCKVEYDKLPWSSYEVHKRYKQLMGYEVSNSK